MRPFKDRRTRQLQTLFRMVEVDAPPFKVCHCRPSAPMVEAVTVSPVCVLLTARCTLEQVQAESDARTSFRDGTRIPLARQVA